MTLKETLDVPITEPELTEALVEYATEQVQKKRVREFMNRVMIKVEKQDKMVKRIIMNADVYSLVRRYERDGYEAVTERAKLIRGHLGYYFRAELWVDRNFPEPIAIADPSNNEVGCFMPLCEERL